MCSHYKHMNKSNFVSLYLCKLCVCLWSVTSVHLKLFSCRQAHSARSGLLHLVKRPLFSLFLRLHIYECMLSGGVWLHVCEAELQYVLLWRLLSHAPMQIQENAQMRIYLFCRHTHTRAQISLAATIKLISILFPFHPLFQACVSCHDSRKASEVIWRQWQKIRGWGVK